MRGRARQRNPSFAYPRPSGSRGYWAVALSGHPSLHHLRTSDRGLVSAGPPSPDPVSEGAGDTEIASSTAWGPRRSRGGAGQKSNLSTVENYRGGHRYDRPQLIAPSAPPQVAGARTTLWAIASPPCPVSGREHVARPATGSGGGQLVLPEFDTPECASLGSARERLGGLVTTATGARILLPPPPGARCCVQPA